MTIAEKIRQAASPKAAQGLPFVRISVIYEYPDVIRHHAQAEMPQLQAEVYGAGARAKTEILFASLPAAGLLAAQDRSLRAGHESMAKRFAGDTGSQGEDPGGAQGAGGRGDHRTSAQGEAAIEAHMVVGT
jgi:hypothetical protein